MNKDAHFTGQPIFSQLLNLIPGHLIRNSVLASDSDRYYKKFKSKDHLVTMLYCIYHKCTSLREARSGMLACGGRLNHLMGVYGPPRSTLSDANQRRDQGFFERLYGQLYQEYGQALSDSGRGGGLSSRLYIVDSTTISLFKEILKNAGRTPSNGKRKGGVKAHVLLRSDRDVPGLVRVTAASAHDVPFLQRLDLAEGSILVFDKGYLGHGRFQELGKAKVTWVTRIRASAVYETQ